MEDQVASRAAFHASISLLVFGTFTTFALVGWFHQVENALSWKSVLAGGCALVAVATSSLLWRNPLRTHAMMGIACMLFSLLRVGPPSEWTWVSFALVAVTCVLMMPVVQAAMVLKDEEPA